MEIDYQSIKDWPFSTLHRYLEEGLYPANWGEGVSLGSKEISGE